jgi:hypothetical protein
MTKNLTLEQRFKRLFDLSNDESTTPQERETAQRKWREWLKRHNRKAIDIGSILAQAARDDDAANPSPPPPTPDPRASGDGHVFDDPTYNPAMLLEDVVCRYLVMRPHVRVIYGLWIVATHVYEKFRIAPRVLLTSEHPDSGKSTALELARRLAFRANDEAFVTDAALRDHFDQGPGTVVIDEADLYEPGARRALLRLWNGGHAPTKHGKMSGGQRKQVSLFAPVIAAGLGRILGQAQLTRTFVLVMTPYSVEENRGPIGGRRLTKARTPQRRGKRSLVRSMRIFSIVRRLGSSTVSRKCRLESFAGPPIISGACLLSPTPAAAIGRDAPARRSSPWLAKWPPSSQR